jgi:hypothetical protein
MELFGFTGLVVILHLASYGFEDINRRRKRDLTKISKKDFGSTAHWDHGARDLLRLFPKGRRGLGRGGRYSSPIISVVHGQGFPMGRFVFPALPLWNGGSVKLRTARLPAPESSGL